MKNLREKIIVSCETSPDLKCYQSILIEWQKKFNLVSKNSLNDAWVRHFLDSAQICEYIPDDASEMVDFGSGAGFPGLVVAVLTKNRTPYLNITLVESIKKKTLFLNEVSAKLKLHARIENERIENLAKKTYDVITSRAMCSLDKLLGYALPFCGKKTICIFPKGKSYAEEIATAQKLYSFKCETKDNLFSDEGKILLITDIKPLKGENNAKNTRNR